MFKMEKSYCTEYVNELSELHKIVSVFWWE